MKKKAQHTSKDKGTFFRSIIYFFPIQLVFVHLKKNHQLLLFWLILFLIIFKQIGNKYGIPLLFLAPEYLGKLSFSSYFIMGFSVGGFVMAYNISSYIMNGFRFPFLATLSKPFLKYFINNSLIPLIFVIAYSFQAYNFLSTNEAFSNSENISLISGFLGGFFIFIIFSMLYFIATNKDLEKLFGKEIAKVVGPSGRHTKPARDLLSNTKERWYKDQSRKSKVWKVSYYIGHYFKIRRTRRFDHYDQKMLHQVFRQNHINASIFEIIVIVSILTLGLFRENEVFIIPAAATFTLVFTMLLMITSAIRSWLHGWTWVIIAVVLIILNILSKHNNFYYESRAYGLDYSSIVDYPKADKVLLEEEEKDKKLHEKMFNKWKSKNKMDSNKKPKAVFIACSGGGSRAMYWSFLALQHLDSLSNGELFQHSIMNTGSSGGMIGAAYFRELKLRSMIDSTVNPYHSKYSQDMAKDLLNPLVFTWAVNDMLIRTQKFEYEGNKYWKDRAYIFEEVLSKHSRGFMDKKLIDYKEAEENATIPLMILSPSIVNDGRRMLIGNLPMAFMRKTELQEKYLSENVEYQHLFKNNNPLNTRFLTALRMNASFPYIMTTVNMPSQPMIELFDAGLRDNYGIKSIAKYIYNMRDWLEENTSGIVILQIRDGIKTAYKPQKAKKQSIFSRLLTPFGSLYGNWFQVQDYNNDELIEYASEWYSGEVELINYQLYKEDDQTISLSWHLTSKEKELIAFSLNTIENKIAEERLLELLNYDN